MKTHLFPATALLALALLSPSALAEARKENNAVTLKLVSMSEPRFPTDLIRRGVMSGDVDALVTIGADGVTSDSLVVAYSHPELAATALATLKDCRFEPVLVNGAAGPVRARVTLAFETRGAVISHTPSDSIDAWLSRMMPAGAVRKLGTRGELDREVKVMRAVQPGFEKQEIEKAPGARVVIDFFIDENGRARMPVLAAGEKGPLAEAAAAALLEWQFEPPTRGGLPAIVNVKQEFVFGR